ncbi:hypothetical protein JHD47_02265 [Sulfurimonas sp. SAG-AH-194-L11]|nr:hypothetical protein [Sulfurimonas sp. SAG-AH-194-L11]MDF1876637.1 hypothetical protein [Sulfurimonas sp. SAG-AH-194-L11]
MNIFKVFVFSILLIISVVGCGGEGNSDSNPSASAPPQSGDIIKGSATVILEEVSKELTLNQQSVFIDMKVVNSENASPYNGGNVKIIYPKEEVFAGRDIGSFVSSSVLIENGSVRFSYTGPTQLSKDTSDIVFYFYYESNPSVLSKFTFTLNPNPNQIILKDYKILSDITTLGAKIGLETAKKISFFIAEDNENSTLVSDAKINFINVKTLNSGLAVLSNTQAETNATSLILTTENNSFSIILKSSTLSGIVPLKVNTSFTDANGNTRVLSKVFNILIISGPPNAMSLNYAASIRGPEAGFIERWTLRVTDKYNNLVNTNPSISMGLIVGFAKDASLSGVGGTNNNYLYFDEESSSSGTLSKVNNTFTSLANVFPLEVDKMNIGIDTLVLFGKGYTYNASGKWDITEVINSSSLHLTDIYDGNDTSPLGFAVGHNFRQIPSAGEGEAIANVYPVDRNYTLGDNGTMGLEIAGDPYLVGKTLMLWTNFIGNNGPAEEIVRVGEARKITIRYFGLKADAASVSRGSTAVVKRIPIFVEDIGDRYHNGNFAYEIKVSDNLVINSYITSSISDYQAYVDVNVTDVDGNSTGTIEITNLKIVEEF